MSTVRYSLPGSTPRHEHIELCVRCGRGATVFCRSHERYLCGVPSQCFDLHHFSTHSTCDLEPIAEHLSCRRWLDFVQKVAHAIDRAAIPAAVTIFTVTAIVLIWAHWFPV
jgi:hypothetical protein